MFKKIIKHFKMGTLFSAIFYRLNNNRFYFIASERLTGYRKEKARFKKCNGYELDLKNPVSVLQKVEWKKIHDRNPLLPVTSDKYRVREYLKDMLGIEAAEKILVPLLYVTDKPETIPFEILPEEFIIKANHGSGTNIIIDKENPADREKIILQCRKWLSTSYGLLQHEWAYQKIKRKIIIEKLLRGEDGGLPKDYKFDVIHGKCHLIEVYSDRHTDLKGSYFDTEWQLLDVGWKGKEIVFLEKPKNLNDMIALAELLGSNFDYVRVDLYSVCGQVYFGEMTHYTGSGCSPFDPISYDFELGLKWKLIPQYWKNQNLNPGI